MGCHRIVRGSCGRGRGSGSDQHTRVQARAQLLLTDNPTIVTFQNGGAPKKDPRADLETQYRLLRRRSLARRVIEELNLWDDFRMTSGRPSQFISASAFLGRLHQWIPLGKRNASDGLRESTPAEERDPRETIAESRAIDHLLAQLEIVPIRDTRIIEVRYQSTDPELAARIVNTLTQTYTRQSLEARSLASQEASTWLAAQLAEQRRKVEASELALQQYRERKDSLSLEAGQNIVVQRLNALNAAVTQAKTDLVVVEARYRQLVASEGNPEMLDTFAPIRSNPLVQEIRARLASLQHERMQLAAHLGAKHPEIIRLDTAISGIERELMTEVAKTVESIRHEYLAALAREKELTAALDTQKASALALNRQGIEYGVLLREVESNRRIYESLLQRANETAVSSELMGSNVEVVDAAEIPRSPVGPNTQSNLLIGLVLSAVFAIVTAFVREAFDNRVQTPSTVKGALNLHLLGTLPYLSKRALKGKSPLLSSGVPAAYAEACRALRTNILASAGTKTHRSLLVTSASPGTARVLSL